MKVKTHVKAGGGGYHCTTDADCPQGGKCEQTCIQTSEGTWTPTGMCTYS
jgi:hypothetical protein